MCNVCLYSCRSDPHTILFSVFSLFLLPISVYRDLWLVSGPLFSVITDGCVCEWYPFSASFIFFANKNSQEAHILCSTSAVLMLFFKIIFYVFVLQSFILFFTSAQITWRKPRLYYNYLCCHGYMALFVCVCVQWCWLMGTKRTQGQWGTNASLKATAFHGRMGRGGIIYTLLVATPASGISKHNTSYSCQAFSSLHTSAVTVRLRITTGTKQLRATFISSSSFGRLHSFQVRHKHLLSVSQ